MKPPQHHRKRGYRKTLASVLRHVEVARCGYDDASWLFYHIAGLRSRLDHAEGELKGMRENVDAWRKDHEYLDGQLRQQGKSLIAAVEEGRVLRAVLETRQATVGALAYALEGLVKDATLTHEERIEMANRWLATKGYHDVEEFYPPNEEADDA